MSSKILIPHPLNHRTYGGIDVVILEVVKRIDSFDFEILTPEPHPKRRKEFEDHVDFRTFNKRLPGWGTDYRRPSVKKELDDADLIWNNTVMHNDIVAKAETPVITGFHSVRKTKQNGFPRNLTDLKRRFDYWQIHRGMDYFPEIERIVSVSDRSKNIVDRKTTGNSVKIYNGGDTFGSELSKEDDGYILSFDNPEIAIYVASKLDYHVKVLGGSKDMKRKAEKWDADVEFIQGFLSKEQMSELYRKCSFYISGSFRDGFGITPIEANHFGKPSIVFKKEVTAETIKNGVNGFEAGNTYEMVEKAKELVEDKQKRLKMGESAYEYANENFTWDKTAKRYEEEFSFFL